MEQHEHSKTVLNRLSRAAGHINAIKKMVEDLTPMLAYEALTKKAIQSRLNQPMHRINYVLTKLQREGIVKGFRIKTSECGISEDNAPAWFYKYTLTDNAQAENLNG